MSYNLTAFNNNPELANSPGVLYHIVLVDKKSHLRECIKIGIAKGTTWQAAVKRAKGFKHYDLRIQKVVSGTLRQVYNLEQYLHDKYKDFQHIPKHDFGGKTECFDLSINKLVLKELKELNDLSNFS